MGLADPHYIVERMARATLAIFDPSCLQLRGHFGVPAGSLEDDVLCSSIWNEHLAPQIVVKIKVSDFST
jgi:hypothetical protein